MVKVISTTTAAALLLIDSSYHHSIGVTGSEVSSELFSEEIIENNNEPNEYYYTYETTEEEEQQTIEEKGEDISRDTFVTSQVHVDTEPRYYDDDTVTSATRPPKPPTITSADGDGEDSWGGSGKTSEQTSEDMSMKQSWWSGSGKSGKSGSRYDYDCDEWGTSEDSWSGGKSGKSGYSSSSSSGSWGTSGDYMMSMPKTMMTSEDGSWRSLRSDDWEGSSSSGNTMPPKTMMTSEDDGQQWSSSSHSMPNTSNDSWGEWKPKSAKAFSKGGKWSSEDHMSMHSWGSGKSGKSGSKCGKVRNRSVHIIYV